MAARGTSHESFSAVSETKTSSDRSFGIVFTVVFLLIGLFPLLDDKPPFWWALALSAVFAVAALFAPRVLAPLNRVWAAFGLLLHKIVSPVVMGGLFFLVVTPFGLLMRVTGHDPMGRRYDPDAKTYWVERTPHGPAPESIKQQF